MMRKIAALTLVPLVLAGCDGARVLPPPSVVAKPVKPAIAGECVTGDPQWVKPADRKASTVERVWDENRTRFEVMQGLRAVCRASLKGMTGGARTGG
jgi:hypothetical protein